MQVRWFSAELAHSLRNAAELSRRTSTYPRTSPRLNCTAGTDCEQPLVRSGSDHYSCSACIHSSVVKLTRPPLYNRRNHCLRYTRCASDGRRAVGGYICTCAPESRDFSHTIRLHTLAAPRRHRCKPPGSALTDRRCRRAAAPLRNAATAADGWMAGRADRLRRRADAGQPDSGRLLLLASARRQQAHTGGRCP